MRSWLVCKAEELGRLPILMCVFINSSSRLPYIFLSYVFGYWCSCGIWCCCRL
ncbi:hypothetical protein BDV35DRAFT_355045 [Aspergillus flavus]|uniref:Uncharacterized protein n=1 Tax=Aspergillus flavus TaxID=5059 RepID=A0A5N6GYM2_ASPFL|nr:hypothetical protein BDV35DRAFT_355045 [Aspergillus flavus]